MIKKEYKLNQRYTHTLKNFLLDVQIEWDEERWVCYAEFAFALLVENIISWFIVASPSSETQIELTLEGASCVTSMLSDVFARILFICTNNRETTASMKQKQKKYVKKWSNLTKASHRVCLTLARRRWVTVWDGWSATNSHDSHLTFSHIQIQLC